MIAGLLGFVQATIWIFAVGTAIRYIDSAWHVLGYAGGYAAGNMIGITIEQAVAYGLSTVRIISPHGVRGPVWVNRLFSSGVIIVPNPLSTLD